MSRLTSNFPTWFGRGALLLLGATGVSTLGAGQMLDPAIDRTGEEWCNAAQSTTVIGLPFVPEPVQVTYDGAVYTRHAELAFLYGEALRPVMARNKTFRDGWIPVVGHRWSDAGVDYRLEIFSAEPPELGRTNLVQFARPLLQVASIQGRVAQGPQAGARLARLAESGPTASKAARVSLCAEVDGFSLHAGVWVRAHDRERLEHLCRGPLPGIRRMPGSASRNRGLPIARPPLAAGRPNWSRQGRVLYELRKCAVAGHRGPRRSRQSDRYPSGRCFPSSPAHS